MRYLLFSIVCCLSCASDYKALKPSAPDPVCAEKIRPLTLQSTWFNASVDVAGKHISGLLLIKNMEDSSTRMVFTNQAGIKFFDFEFGHSNTFKVHDIMDKLDKKAVVNTLRNDFELILGVPFRNESLKTLSGDQSVYIGYPWKDITAYTITDKNCISLQRIETGSDKKKLVTLKMSEYTGLPDSITLQHHTFNMVIKLTKLNKD